MFNDFSVKSFFFCLIDFPEFSNIIKSYSVGATLKSRNVKNVAKQITELLSIPKTHWSAKLSKAKQAYCWKNQEIKLLSFFK